jgi:hypothetical protein
MTGPRASFDRLWVASQDGVAWVLHQRTDEKRVLRPFHSDVLLSVVLQLLAAEDDRTGHPLYLDVGANQYRRLFGFDMPWVLAVQQMSGRLFYPIADGAVPPVYVFAHLTADQRARAFVRDAPPLNRLHLPPGVDPREPRRVPPAKRLCLLPPDAEQEPVLHPPLPYSELVDAHGALPFPGEEDNAQQ